MIGTMVGDVLAETVGGSAMRESRRSTRFGPPGASWPASPKALRREERELKRFLYARLYGLSHLRPVREEAQRVVAELAAAYRADPALLPADWHRADSGVEQLRTIGDFVAGMTDRFAIARHEEIIGPVNLPADRF